MRPRDRIEPVLAHVAVALLGATACAIELATATGTRIAQRGLLAQLDDDRTQRFALWVCAWGAFVVLAGKQRRFLLRAVPEERAVPGTSTYRSEPRIKRVLSDDDDDALRHRTRLSTFALAGSAACALIAEARFAWIAWLSLLSVVGATLFVRQRSGRQWALGLPLLALGVLASTSIAGGALLPVAAGLGMLFSIVWLAGRRQRAQEPFGGYGELRPEKTRARGARERSKRRVGLALAVLGLSTIGARGLAKPDPLDAARLASAGAPAAFRGDVPALVDGGLLDARSSAGER